MATGAVRLMNTIQRTKKQGVQAGGEPGAACAHGGLCQKKQRCAARDVAIMGASKQRGNGAYIVMYVGMKTILDDAAQKGYAVVAANAVNMEMARGVIAAAHARQAPLIIILGGMQMARHANGELMIPLIRTMAEEANVPVATCLDHGSSFEKAAYAYRIGFSSVMIDASTYEMEENIRRTRQVVELCHSMGVSVEGELGHVGQAANMDGRDEAMYTKPEDAAHYVKSTGVDCLAIAAGTAHGKYPQGFVPTINFDVIRRVKEATNHMPLALHGSSGSGDENVLKAVEAGINKINVATELQLAGRNAVAKALAQHPDMDYIEMLQAMEAAVRKLAIHWIGLSGSCGKAPGIQRPDGFRRFMGYAAGDATRE